MLPPARLQHIKDRTMPEEERIIPANVSYEITDSSDRVVVPRRLFIPALQ
jgi:hypothetical protein